VYRTEHVAVYSEGTRVPGYEGHFVCVPWSQCDSLVKVVAYREAMGLNRVKIANQYVYRVASLKGQSDRWGLWRSSMDAVVQSLIVENQ